MKRIVKGLLWCCVLELIACTSVPVNTHQDIAKTSLSHLAWWNKLNDPRLNQLIKQALAKNTQLLEAKEKTLQAKAQLKAAYAAWLPTLSVAASGITAQGWDSHMTSNAGLTSLDSINTNAGYAGFMPAYSLNVLETMNNTRMAKASLAMQRASYHALRLSIISQTAGAYFSLVGQKEQVQHQKDYIVHLKKLYQLEYVRFKDGASDRSVMVALDQDIADSEAKRASLEYSVTHNQNALQLLIDQAPGVLAVNQSLARLDTNAVIPPDISASVLKYRPDIMIAKERLNKAHALVGLSYAAWFPNITLTGLLGGASLDLTQLLKLTTGLGAAQMAAQMSLFNAPAYQQIQASKAGVKAAGYSYLYTLRAALVDVENNLTQYEKKHEAAILQLNGYHAVLRAYSLVMARYQSGLVDRRALLRAQLKVDQAQMNWTAAKIDELYALVGVYQALAGGYRVN